jgi:hypothetical protein
MNGAMPNRWRGEREEARVARDRRYLLTDDSRLLAGGRGTPVKLKAHLEKVKRAFRLPEVRGDLPRSIRGLWRADLFVGAPSREQWVATTLKTNASQLEGGAGIRIGVYPEERRGDGPSFDKSTREEQAMCRAVNGRAVCAPRGYHPWRPTMTSAPARSTRVVGARKAGSPRASARSLPQPLATGGAVVDVEIASQIPHIARLENFHAACRSAGSSFVAPV